MNKDSSVNKNSSVDKGSTESPLEHPEETLEQKINRETARIHWKELETHFAAGQLISVAPELDLISVAKAMTNNDTVTIKQWMDARQVTPTSDAQAVEWQAYNAELWAAVIKPWVLVQTVSADKNK